MNMVASVINKRVLMLNQNYEPLTVCSARRAVVLMFQGKAEMIEESESLRIRTVSTSYSLPSVVRLWQYRKVPYKRIVLTRKNVLIRDSFKCQYCLTRKGPMTVDHIVPKTMGGGELWHNLVCACSRCNNRKGDRTPDMAGMKLNKKPRRPSHITFIQREGGVSELWHPYLFMDSKWNGAEYFS